MFCEVTMGHFEAIKIPPFPGFHQVEIVGR
jgi:hypothetical protein